MRRRVPFVWLADQRIDHAAGFATLRGAPLRREEEGTNRWVLARGRFDVPPSTASLDLAVTVDGRYRAWLNGATLGRGPVRSAPHFQRYDAYRAAVRPGANLIALLVHVPGVDLAWYESAKGAWQPVFGDGGIYVEARSGKRHVEIEWRLIETEAWRRDTKRAGWGQDFIEDFDARQFDPGWIEPEFDDSGWPAGRPMISTGDAAAEARGFGRVDPFPVLAASGIPQAVEEIILPSAILWVKAAEPRPDLPLDERLYSELLLPAASDAAEHVDALLSHDGDGAVIRTAGGRDTALMLSFEPYHAGRPFIEIDAQGGEVVELAVAEALPGEFGRGLAGDGLRQEGHLGVAHLFRYTARPGRQRFEKFNWTALRAMQIVVRNAPQGLKIRRVGSLATHYPALPVGRFECSDPLLNRLWEVGRHTVLQCMHDSWVDCPGREARQWVGDALVQSDVATMAFGPSAHPLQRQFLRQASEGQRADGLVRMFAPGDIDPDALVIPDFTLLWLIAAGRFYAESGDLDTIDAVFPAIERGLAWFERHLGEHGLLVDVPHWHFIEWAHLDRRGEAAAINALYVGALDAVAVLAEAAARPRVAERCNALRDRAAASLNARHWDGERGVYVDSVDPDSGARRPRISQHANALMLLFDIAPAGRVAQMLAAITDEARLKLTAAPPIVPDGPPFDEEKDIVRANSFFLHFVYSGLARRGAFDWVIGDIRRVYGPMLATGTTTLWESFSPNASLCHGFSATPVFQLSRHCLGIAPLAPGYGAFSIDPDPADLDWARGAVPTPFGPIIVDWRKEGGRLSLSLEHPAECRPVVQDKAKRRLVADERTGTGAALRFEFS
jgi:alpha-L-rhamnosidase